MGPTLQSGTRTDEVDQWNPPVQGTKPAGSTGPVRPNAGIFRLLLARVFWAPLRVKQLLHTSFRIFYVFHGEEPIKGAPSPTILMSIPSLVKVESSVASFSVYGLVYVLSLFSCNFIYAMFLLHFLSSLLYFVVMCV